MPWRNDLEAAKNREDALARELEAASQHTDELRDMQKSGRRAKPPSPPLFYRIRSFFAGVFRPLRSVFSGWKFSLFPICVIGFFVGLPLFAKIAASSCGYKATVIAAVENCPEAVDLLGDDIHIGYWGIACGSTSIGDSDVGHDYADWRVPISGSNSSGVYRFYAADFGDGWLMKSGEIEVDGKRVDLSQCSRSETSTANDKSPTTVLQDACDKENARACRDLSLLYQYGNTVEKDKERASELAARACKLGLKSSCP